MYCEPSGPGCSVNSLSGVNSVSVSVYLFARKKIHIHTDIQYITKMLFRD